MKNRSLAAVKIILFFSCVTVVLSAFLNDSPRQILSFISVFLIFASLIMLAFYKKGETVTAAAPEKESTGEADAGNRHAEIEAVSQAPVQTDSARHQQLSKEELNKEKITVLNKFASVASHDLKNPLSSLKNIAYYFTNSVKIEGEVPNKMLRMLGSEVDRMNKMIVDLLDSTRVKHLTPVKSDIDSLIRGVIEEETDEKYAFEEILEHFQAVVDPSRFRQIIASVIKNSKDAMPDGGKIVIRSFKSGHDAVIEISDNGKGMDEDTLNKCFDPMFSTKQARALGMSLTVSRQIVNMLGGSMTAESSFNKGSKFTIKLPLAM